MKKSLKNIALMLIILVIATAPVFAKTTEIQTNIKATGADVPKDGKNYVETVDLSLAGFFFVLNFVFGAMTNGKNVKAENPQDAFFAVISGALVNIL